MNRFPSERTYYLGLTEIQYYSLRTATLVCSSISLVASFVTIVTYVYLRSTYRQRADRVSLRCVLFAALADMTASIMSISIVLLPDSSKHCLPTAIVFMFFAVVAAGFLTMIGVNLVIIFVLNIKYSTLRLQIIYFITVSIYSLLSIIGPIYITEHPCALPEDDATCWFALYFESSRCGDSIWIFFYSFLMSLVVLGLLCSFVAGVKLVREQYIKFGQILGRGPGERRHQTAMIARVLLRCVLYPLVPFIANIWGFISQTIVFKEDVDTTYGLAMFGAVFGSLVGVFITFMFFTDPTVTSLFIDIRKRLYQHYVKEYQRINITQYDHFDHQVCAELYRNCYQCKQEAIQVSHREESEDNYHPNDSRNIYFKHEVTSSSTSLPPPSSQPSPKRRKTKSIPIRCVNVPLAMRYRNTPSPTNNSPVAFGNDIAGAGSGLKSPSAIYRPSSDDPHRLERNGSTPIITNDHPDTTKAYIPYRYPRIASLLHFIFKQVMNSNNDSGPTNNNIIHPYVESDLQRPEQIHASSDTISRYSSSALQQASSIPPPMVPDLAPSFSTGQL
ncbi:hypothetical protein INT45_002867 [Circinella minor]|uniref:Uncharacterized protein n=1 Tax=Circinella minor TaxID=1195481 RepID=A0A8H7VLJ4_9FUNG|nr:hypothetical protein INT45_002867 [Circinella minor]